jgi:hypothetical protein
VLLCVVGLVCCPFRGGDSLLYVVLKRTSVCTGACAVYSRKVGGDGEIRYEYRKYGKKFPKQCLLSALLTRQPVHYHVFFTVYDKRIPQYAYSVSVNEPMNGWIWMPRARTGKFRSGFTAVMR